MGRFLAFLFVFILGGAIGLAIGGFGGAALGGYTGACKVIDTAVAQGSMTQDQANAIIKSAASELGVKPEDKQRIVDALKKSNQPETPCSIAIGSI